MTNGRKVKVSLTLPADLLAAVDRHASGMPAGSRSAAVEELVRRGVQARAEADLRREVVAYYRSLDGDEQREEEAIARASSRAARKLEVRDGAPRPRGRSSR